MRLTPGTRLGTYEVVSGLGAGGMGEVYRALDTTLRREVALKIVHPDYCHHPDSLTRLRREARALAALNHPNVATLHELAEFGGSCGLIMELVGGETLADLLRRRRLKFDEAAVLAAQIASALEAAHQHDIVHRDLKPANIKVTADGIVKVLDFGLAKAADEDEAMSTLATSPGAVLGTAPYMSPEQARGANVDRRTDIWAFGCVLFEMLAGQLAFDGPSRSDIVVRILEKEPDWAMLPADTPQPVRRLLKRCLQKDARRRLRDIGDARLELEDAAAGDRPSDAGTVPAPITTRPHDPFLRSAALVAAGITIGALAMFVFAGSRRGVDSQSEIRFAMTLPDDERIASTELGSLAMHPDGRTVVYVASRGVSTMLLLRTLDGGAAKVLQGTAGAVSPFFSPDGNWVAYFADGKLKKIAVSGGSPVTICDAADGLGGSWSSTNTIVFASATGSSLQRVSADGGTPSRATELDVARGEFSHRWPEFLPDGETVLFTVGTVGEWDEAEIVAQSMRTGTRTSILKGGTNPRYVAPGLLTYAHDRAIWVTSFDARRLAVNGAPTRAIEDVATSVDGAVQFAVSHAGTAVYHRTTPASARRLVIVDGNSVTPLAAAPHSYVAPRVSPDGKKLVAGVSDDAEHIWSYDLSAGTLTQLTFEAANRSPIWSADGARVTFASNRNGAFNVFSVPAAEEGPAERLTTTDSLQLPGSWSPDGELLALTEQSATSGRDVWLLRRNGDRIPFATGPADESAPRFSPDGKRVAYVSNQSGQPEVYVRDVTATGPGRKISVDNGTEPVWRRDGAAVYFRSYDKLLMAPLAGGAPRVVFDGVAEAGTFDAPGYDVITGTDRLLMMVNATAGAAPSELRMILNWSPALNPSSR